MLKGRDNVQPHKKSPYSLNVKYLDKKIFCLTVSFGVLSTDTSNEERTWIYIELFDNASLSAGYLYLLSFPEPENHKRDSLGRAKYLV